MSKLIIADLAQTQLLDASARSLIHGGRSWLGGWPSDGQVNVNVGIFQDQKVAVNVLNHSVIGAGLKFGLDVAPNLWANVG